MKKCSLRLYALLTRHILTQDWICEREGKVGGKGGGKEGNEEGEEGGGGGREGRGEEGE